MNILSLIIGIICLIVSIYMGFVEKRTVSAIASGIIAVICIYTAVRAK